MYLLYLAALIGAVSGLDRLTSPELQFVNFARAIIGRKLNGSIIKEIDVHAESSCQFACVREARCLSYNFGPAEDKKTFKCQLCDSDRFVTVKNFTKNGEFLYRGTQVISNPRDKIVIFFSDFIQARDIHVLNKNQNRENISTLAIRQRYLQYALGRKTPKCMRH